MKRIIFFVFLAAISGMQAKAQIKDFPVKTSSKTPCTTLVGDLMMPGMPDTSGRNVADNYKTWENGTALLVKFMDNIGSPAVRERITRAAKEWEKYANITLKFVPDNTPVTKPRVFLGSRPDER